jgi:nitric oxide reductase large subunit
MITQKPTIDFTTRLPDPLIAFRSNGEVVMAAFNMLQQHCHAASYNRGWWHDPITGASLLPGDDLATKGAFTVLDLNVFRKAWFPYVVATKIALIHSEVSEMMEGHRSGHWDDKIAFPMMTAEAADTMIRLFDLFGMLQWAQSQHLIEHDEGAGYYSIGEALLSKLPYNVTRADHALEKRAQPGQKKY